MKDNNRRSLRGRLFIAALAAMLAWVLCACDGCNGFVQGCSMIQSWYEPQLVSSSDLNAAPVLTHSPDANEVNKQLRDFYEPVNDLISTANLERYSFSLEHKLTDRDGSWYLQSSIQCDPEGTIELPEIYIPYFGQAQLPALDLPTIEDQSLAAVWLELTANGIDFDLSRLEEQLSAAQLMELYVGYYEQLSGLEPDVSRFADTAEFGLLQRKAVVLGMLPWPEYYENDRVDSIDLANAAAALLSSVYNDACGCGTEGYDRVELIETIRLFLNMDIYPEQEWAQSVRLLNRLCDEKLAECDPDDHRQLFRQETAQMMVELYEMMYGKIDVPDYYYDWLGDTEDEYCIKANWLGIMPDFPGPMLFAETYEAGRHELPEFVKNFAGVCRLACMDDDPEDMPAVTYRDAMYALSMVDVCARERGICEEEPTVVINNRDYEWYYTQHGTGRYSLLNCMPTITMMATKWYDEDTTVTVEEMRERYLPDNTGGWYTWQVAECLDQNGVPNELAELTEDKLEYLNDGKIILSQMTEAAYDASGHCFVIYGYWKRGDTVKYYVHDPDVYDGIDEYGRRPGYAMVMDGRYCDWIIDRIAFNYIAVGE